MARVFNKYWFLEVYILLINRFILIKYRLLQNRVSAQRFRQKRKNEFENLKDNLRRLIQENEMLRNQVSAFELLWLGKALRPGIWGLHSQTQLSYLIWSQPFCQIKLFYMPSEQKAKVTFTADLEGLPEIDPTTGDVEGVEPREGDER